MITKLHTRRSFHGNIKLRISSRLWNIYATHHMKSHLVLSILSLGQTCNSDKKLMLKLSNKYLPLVPFRCMYIYDPVYVLDFFFFFFFFYKT